MYRSKVDRIQTRAYALARLADRYRWIRRMDSNAAHDLAADIAVFRPIAAGTLLLSFTQAAPAEREAAWQRLCWKWEDLILWQALALETY